MSNVDVALIYSDDTYGQSFHDWFGYYATERQLHVAGEGIVAYKNGMDLTSFLDEAVADSKNKRLVICVALSDVADYKRVTDQVHQWYNKAVAADGDLQVQVILSDTGQGGGAGPRFRARRHRLAMASHRALRPVSTRR